MKSFDYIAPTSIEEACRALAEAGGRGKVLAGGTDVLIELRKEAQPFPDLLVDISRLKALNLISDSEGEFHIGPLVTHAELAASDVVKRRAPLLRQAARSIGSPQIRNRGTIGGNIMNAAACADTVPPLMVLGATVTLTSSAGTRVVPLGEFFLKPYVTAARSDEILTRISVKHLPAGAGGAFIKLGRRNALSIARLSVATILVKNQDGTIKEARIVPGAAFPRWQRVPEAEALLGGRLPSTALFADAGRKVAEIMVALSGRRWSTEYKEPVVAVLVRRALEACVG